MPEYNAERQHLTRMYDNLDRWIEANDGEWSRKEDHLIWRTRDGSVEIRVLLEAVYDKPVFAVTITQTGLVQIRHSSMEHPDGIMRYPIRTFQFIAMDWNNFERIMETIQRHPDWKTYDNRPREAVQS